MAELDFEQIEFLEKMGIEDFEVLDAEDWERRDYIPYMKENDYAVAIGVSECKYGHTMRTRSGHCAMCNNGRNLAHQINFHTSKDIYVAYSSSKNVIKIGISDDYEKRIDQMNSYGYGGIYDWECVFSEWVRNSGRIESLAHESLKEYRYDLSYMRGSTIEVSREVFECSIEDAIDAVNDAIDSYDAI
ncbi:Bacteriophage T5, Orf172 DNA-binding [Candidatus Methylopumilus planktonicus]|uniref:GIY-YIG nuclease family protein n=1 Tax=Candidatus Methylopumilus planktonicus TaxID=1581557 RepID=UPI003BEF0486